MPQGVLSVMNIGFPDSRASGYYKQCWYKFLFMSSGAHVYTFIRNINLDGQLLGPRLYVPSVVLDVANCFPMQLYQFALPWKVCEFLSLCFFTNTCYYRILNFCWSHECVIVSSCYWFVICIPLVTDDFKYLLYFFFCEVPIQVFCSFF